MDFQLDASGLQRSLRNTRLDVWSDALANAVAARAPSLRHGKLPIWRAAIERLPRLEISDRHLGSTVGVSGRFQNARDRSVLIDALTDLMPWRKGPFRIADVDIDCEWRSDLKWDRLIDAISPLEERTVLDVGCGSGYHLWRMREAGARLVMGIDPGLLFLTQFDVLQHYLADPAVACLPLTLDALPRAMATFDTVFSMGVLYHRRDPDAHLAELKAALRVGGELILETLVSDVETDSVIELDGRYARMRNIWLLPGTAAVERWLVDAGFTDVRTVSIDVTGHDEQRRTRWMPHDSLDEALDRSDPSLTIEGWPRPRRALLLARKPDTIPDETLPVV